MQKYGFFLLKGHIKNLLELKDTSRDQDAQSVNESGSCCSSATRVPTKDACRTQVRGNKLKRRMCSVTAPVKTRVGVTSSNVALYVLCVMRWVD